MGLIDSIGDGIVGGGGSIAESELEVFEESTASGNGGIASSADEVSMVIFEVGFEV